MNVNDARIAKLTVAQTGGDVQEVAPNAPATGVGGPAPNFDLVLEMEAGSSVGGNYTLTCTCFDHTAGARNPAMEPPSPPVPPGSFLNGPGQFAVPPWTPNITTNENTFDQTATIAVPAGVSGHVFSYTIALVSANGQQVDAIESPLFVLV
jgi:hypothetical protein